MEVRLTCPKALKGEITPPGDKSISHRAVLLNSIAPGKALLENFSASADCLSTVRCLKSLGVEIKLGEVVEVYGGELREAEDVLDCGNSGTTMRLLAGLLSPHPFLSILTGDASLRSRPMDRVIHPLRLMGAEIWGRGKDSRAPLVIKGKDLQGIRYSLPIPSAQVKSAILLAGLFAQGETVIEESIPSRDHTERMLKAMGADLRKEENYIVINPLSVPLSPLSLSIPGDISSAAYFLVAGAIHPQAKIMVRNCGINPTRSGVLEALWEMGAKLEVINRKEGLEPVADLIMESSELRGIELGGEIIPRLIDEIPVLAVAAIAAKGRTVIRDAKELRFKETDRISILVKELSSLGAKIEELPDGMIIYGGRLEGGVTDSYNDHRMAMTLAVASLLATGETVITNAEAVNISYPAFWQEWEKIRV